MPFMQKLLDHYQKLKTGFSCPNCYELFDKSTQLSRKCKHLQCLRCSDPSENICYLCGEPYNSKQIQKYSFSTAVLKRLKNIENILEGNNEDTEYSIEMVRTNMKRNSKGETLLHIACKLGKIEKVRQLIKENVDLNITDYANWAPIHEAIQGNNKDCVELLLSNGALVNIPGENYVTPLHKAIMLNNFEIAELLLSYGADVNIKDYTGRKPFDGMEDNPLNIHKKVRPILKVFLSMELIVYSPALSEDDKFVLTKAKVQFATRQSFLSKKDVNYYIVEEEIPQLSLDVLVCLLNGISIVDRNWISNPTNYSFQSLVTPFRLVNRRSVMNRLMHYPPLFDKMNFFIQEHPKGVTIGNVRLSKEDLVLLIKAGGGTILHRPPILKPSDNDEFYYPFHAAGTGLEMCDNYVIYCEENPPELKYNMKEVKHKSSKWLIECITEFKIKDE